MARRSDQPAGDSARVLRTLALIAVVIGLVALTTAACVLSYSSVHAFALRADVSRSFARIYPYACDATLVLAGCSVLALRGAGLISRVYGWLCFIVLLGTLAASSVAHVADLNMPKRAAEITVAVFPWALVLVAFGLLLALLRHARRRRLGQRASSPVDGVVVPPRAALEPPTFEQADFDQAGFEPDDEEPYDAGTYQAEPYEYVTLQPAADETGAGTTSLEPYDPITHEAPPPNDPTLPNDSTLPDAAASGPPSPPGAALPQRAAVIRPTEMQLRARALRQRLAADQRAAVSRAPDTVPNPTLSPTAPSPDPPSDPPSPPVPDGSDTAADGYTGDTIPRAELSPAPTVDPPNDGGDGNSAPVTGQHQPPELDRPRSSPTPPSD